MPPTSSRPGTSWGNCRQISGVWQKCIVLLQCYCRLQIADCISPMPCCVLHVAHLDPGGAILGVVLKILTQAPTAVDPRYRALHDPAARLYLEAGLIGWARDNLDRDAEHRG